MRIKAQENEKRQDHSCLFPYSISGRSSPMKNTATVPCPAWLPMMVPMSHRRIFPFSFGKRSSTASMTSRASSGHWLWQIKHLPS